MEVGNPTKLPIEEFLETFEKVPRFAISLIIIDRKGRVLLTRRSIDPERGKWHLPGSFLLKNESLEECQKRILRTELGVDDDSEFTLVTNSEDLYKDPRGHVIDAIYKLEVNELFVPKPTDETSEIKFFDKIPQDLGFNHKELLTTLGFK